MKRALLLIIFVVLLSSSVYGAVVHGNTYDISLEKLDDTIIEVDSEPKQTIVAKNGAFSFNLNQGKYQLSARYYENGFLEASIVEEISIKEDEGDYLIDLILFPNFEQEELLNESIIDFDLEEEKSRFWYYAGMIFGVIIVIVLLIVILTVIKPKQKNEETNEDEELQKIIDFIRENDNRTTQKEIRKAFPSSEAKISLMISELEAKGVLQKIKKGRGNIIILKK